MGRLKYNMNHCVWVRLTDVGRAALERQHNDLRKIVPNIGEFKINEDEQGWSEWQMHNLMSSLGDLYIMGCKLPFSTEIELEAPDD